MAHIELTARLPFYDIYYVNGDSKQHLGSISENLVPTAEWFYRAEGLRVWIN
jgi:hypothetical protein